MAARAVIATLLAACAADPLVTEATSDGGSYHLVLQDDVYATGLAEVVIRVSAADSGDAVDVPVTLVASMPDMEHDFAPVELVPRGDGTSAGDVGFGMPGVWDLDGEIGGEGFVLRVAAE